MICILVHSLLPYHVARYNALAEVRGEFMILELASKQLLYFKDSYLTPNQFFVETLFDSSIEEIPSKELSQGVSNALDRMNPNVVISVSYSTPAMRTATLWARTHEALSLMINDTWRGDKRRFLPLEASKSIWCRWAYDGALVAGSLSCEYFTSLGIRRNKIWQGLNVVDNAYFASGADFARKHVQDLREKARLPEKYFLCVARLSQKKNIPRLIKAFERYLKNGGTWYLVVVGSGPQEEELRYLIDGTSSPDRIRIVEWQQYEKMPTFYGLASALILPSISEPWGLVVNEAMAAGLPVLVSRQCGCFPELCWHGINGFVFDPYDELEMANAMLSISCGGSDINQMGKAGQNIIQSFSPTTFAAALDDCLKHIDR